MTDAPSLSDDELDGLLSSRDPLSRTALQSDQTAQSLGRLLQDVLDGDRGSRVRPSYSGGFSTRRRRGGIAVGAGLIAGAAAVVGVVGPGSRSGVAPFAVSPAAAATLGSLSRAVSSRATTPALTQGRDQYQETITSGVGAAGGRSFRVRYRQSAVVQRWSAGDGANRTLTRERSFSWLTPGDAAVYRANRSRVRAVLRGGPEPGGSIVTDTEYPAGDGPDGAAFGHGLPTGAQPLLHHLQDEFNAELVRTSPGLRRAIALGHSEFLLGGLMQILSGSTSAVQRAAAYLDIRYVSGVRVLNGRHDSLGRPGVEIRLVGPADVDTFIVDPRDGTMLQSEAISRTRSGGIPSGAIISREVLLRDAVVRSMGTLPGGRHIPFRDSLSDRG